MLKSNNKIFIQIAAYRDPELLPTLKDIISKAKHPNNLVFSIAWQHSKDEKWDNLDEYKEDPRFKIIDIDYKESKGVCWARNLLQKNYDGEKYTLQMDSHHRFVENWDEKLINIYKKLIKKGHKKPLISGYIPSYEPSTDPKGRVMEPWKMNFDRFSPEGIVHFMPATIDDYRERTEPVPARFYSAHFAFTTGQFVVEVPHDPELYFHGEEHSISVRAFTWGYDLFHLHETIMWHHYTRKGAKRQWDDNSEWSKLNDHAHLRCRKLFGMDGEIYNPTEFGIYGFGPIRTLDDYERYSGIRFKDRKIQKYTLEYKYPPNPHIEDSEEYDKSYLNYFKHCIDVGYNLVPLDDYTFWAVAFEDENGEEIYRQDADSSEIKRMKSDPDGYCKIWRNFYTDKRAYKWIVWPHSEKQGWQDRIEGFLYEKKNIEQVKKIDLKLDKINDVIEKTLDEKLGTDRIMVHLPAYREPELIPTIKDALKNAKHPERIIFGICRQYNDEDKFDNIDEFRNDPRFKIIDIPYNEAKGLAYARALINDTLLEDEEFLLQLDSHHRFTENWDTTLLEWYYDLKNDGHNPLICGYLPFYNPFNDPEERVQEPWLSEAASFYPHGTIFIRPTGVPNWKNLEKPYPARFLSGHFAFGPNKWAKDVRHDPNIFFSGEELNLTVRSFTHGYDLFHPHRVIIWHATMREERSGMLVWDDQYKRGENMWWKQQDVGRARIRQLIGVEDNGFNLEPYTLGDVRTIRDYEKYAGIHFKKKSFQKWTVDNNFPPNPYTYNSEEEWENSFMRSFYYLVNVDRNQLPGNDYNFVLVAFDDENGNGVHTKFIDGINIKKFLNGDGPIHYEEMFLVDEAPSKVVYWGHSPERGWAERVEIKLQ
jgi:hypothetical protein